jgi:hypothetical protein
MRTNLLFAAAMCGLIILGAATLVANRLLFAEQQGLQDVFSIIWSAALCVVLYKMLRNFWPSGAKATGHQVTYSSFLFLTEVVAVLALVMAAIVASIVLTSEGSNPQLVLAAAFVGGSALALLLLPRLVRLLNRRSAQVEKADRRIS